MRATLPTLVFLAACASPTPIPRVSVGPDPADTRHDLVASVDNQVLVGWSWQVDGERVDVVGPRVPASMTSRGQVWTATGTAQGESGPEEDQASVTIRNARPAVTIELAPALPQAGDALVVAAVPWDADGDPLQVRTRWYRDDVLQEGLTGAHVPADTTQRGQTWRVEVSASDGFAWSEPAIGTVSVANGAPEHSGARIQPALPTIGDDLVADITWTDPDGDALTLRYVWVVDGEVVQDSASPRLPAGHHVKGDDVVLRAGASDDGSVPDVVGVASTTIHNSPPTAPIARISPDDPVAGDVLRCQVSVPATDADGDAIARYAAAWTVDGEVYADTRTSVWEGDRIPAGITEGDERWRCTLSAFDGTSWGPQGGVSVDVEHAGFRASQTVAGRTLTCKSTDNSATETTCIGLRVDGKAFPNGLTCTTGWSSTPSPHTDHADFCRLITGRAVFEADYTCGVTAERVTWVGGSWGTRTENGLTESLTCAW